LKNENTREQRVIIRFNFVVSFYKDITYLSVAVFWYTYVS